MEVLIGFFMKNVGSFDQGSWFSYGGNVYMLTQTFGLIPPTFCKFRIIYLLSRWLNLRPEDFSTENQSFRAKLELFLDQLHARAGFAEEVRKLRYILNHQVWSVLKKKIFESTRQTCSNELDKQAAKQREVMMSKSGTELISMIFNAADTQGRRKSSPGSFSKQSMNMFDALHVAQYLTLADYKLFKNIAETEYLTCSQTNDANVHVGAKALLTKRSNMVMIESMTVIWPAY